MFESLSSLFDALHFHGSAIIHRNYLMKLLDRSNTNVTASRLQEIRDQYREHIGAKNANIHGHQIGDFYHLFGNESKPIVEL